MTAMESHRAKSSRTEAPSVIRSAHEPRTQSELTTRERVQEAMLVQMDLV